MNRRELFMLAAMLLACGEKAEPLPLAPRAQVDAAKEIGRAWLADGGEPRDLARLSADLRGGFSTGDFTTHLLTRHRTDLENGRTTRVQGWLLSQTEAKLYAWLALS